MTKKRVQCSYARVLIHVDACFKGSVRLFRVGNLICIEWCTNLSRDIIALNIALTHNTGTFQRSMQVAKAKVSIEVKTGGSGKPKSTKGSKGRLRVSLLWEYTKSTECSGYNLMGSRWLKQDGKDMAKGLV